MMRRRAGRFGTDELDAADGRRELRRVGAEILGTFLLVMVDGGGAVVAALSDGAVTIEARSLATGLLIMAMVYALGDVSGAHFNPAVTLGFAVRRVFPWRKVPVYWGAQLAGAVAAVLVLRLTFGAIAEVAATHPHFGAGTAVVMEAFLTMLLVTIVIGTATRHRIVGPNAALAAGGTVALAGLFAHPVSGASMNPARSLAPALLAGGADVWIYLVGPALGALLGTAVMTFLHPATGKGERTAAEGRRA